MMNEPNRFLAKLQAIVYLLEVGTLWGMLTLAAAGSSEFALGPVARILVVAALPVPCHLLLATHLVWASRAQRQRSVGQVPGLQPQPLPA